MSSMPRASKVRLEVYGTWQGRIQEFWKGGPGKAAKPRTERRRRERPRGASPENFEKLNAISCNLAYIFEIRMASDIIQNGAFAEQKISSGHDFDSHTHAYTPHTSKNSSDFGHYKIQIQFQTYFFRHCIQYKKLTLPKIGGPAPPGSAPAWDRVVCPNWRCARAENRPSPQMTCGRSA